MLFLVIHSVFEKVSRDGILKEIKKLDSSPATQENDIPMKILIEIVETFTDFLHSFLTNALKVEFFLLVLKRLTESRSIRKAQKTVKTTTTSQHCTKYYENV